MYLTREAVFINTLVSPKTS